jgi:glycosyltransferase involved in cell wall biosynthesis
MPEVCLIVPCYNETRRLAGDVVLAFVGAHAGHHVCFVDDGSADGTMAMVDALKARDPARIQTLRLPDNRGKAEAVRQGVLQAAASRRFDIIGYWDADLSTPLEELPAMLAELDANPACGLATGARLKRLGSNIDRLAARHLLGRVFATAASVVLDLPVYDSQCGAKVFRAALAGVLFGEPFSTPWLFDVEVLARLRNHLGKQGVLDAVVEVPLRRWRDVGGSKLGLLQMAAAPAGLFRIHRRYNRR